MKSSLKIAFNLTLVCSAAFGMASCGSQPAANTAANERVGSDVRSNRPAKKSLPAVTIADGREERSPTRNNADSETVAAEVKAKDKEIMKAVGVECDAGSKGIEVLGSVTGAFTKAGAEQKAYLYERCRSGRSFGIGGLLIKEGDAVAAHYVFGENGLYTSVGKAEDINKNGLDEIILAGGGTGQGYTESSVSLFEFGSGSNTFLGRTETYSDNLGSVTDDSKGLATAYKITATPDANPVFMREAFEKRGSSKTWVEAKKTEKLELEKDSPAKFTKIN